MLLAILIVVGILCLAGLALLATTNTAEFKPHDPVHRFHYPNVADQADSNIRIDWRKH